MNKPSAYQPFQTNARALKMPELEVVQNQYAKREYQVRFEIPEFTCVCPKTGHPDFATLTITYVPNKYLIELKSLKLYIEAFRNVGIFHETLANRVLDDLVAAAKPRRAKLTADFNVRGGIHTIVEAGFHWK
jgi:7-cyano-7-deazaguanine reductase